MKKYIPFEILVAVLIILLLIIANISCKTTKHIVSDTTKYDSTAIRKADSLSIEISKLSQSYEKLKTEAAKTKIVFQDVPCPDVVIDSTCNTDSLVKLIRQQEKYIRSLKNTVKVNADGSYELQGQVKEFQASLDKVEKETSNLYIENVKLKITKDSLATALSKATSHTEKKVKRTFMGQWWLFPAGMIFMAIIFNRKKILSKLRG